jgi:hypothetical protein
VFVRVDQAAVDASSRPFVYQAYRDLATAAYLVPFAEAHAVTSQLFGKEQSELISSVLFVQSTGRCGSTLLSKLLHVLSNAYSLSEPDIFSIIQVEATLKSNLMPRDETIRLFRTCTTLLTKAVKVHRKRTDELIVIKHRSFLVLHADLLHEATPEAKVRKIY